MTSVPAQASDAAEVADIYGEAARTSVSTFDLDGLPVQDWRAKIMGSGPGQRFLVARGQDSVLGFAYSTVFRPRPAYARTRETSIYLRADARGTGVGRGLYAQLLHQLRTDGVHVAVAVVAQPNPASNALHDRLGFAAVGTLHEVGHKFGAYVSTRWYQLRLDRWDSTGLLPAPPRRY